MKKKIINGLLFAVAMVAATSSFVSCKDYDADNYNELQAKYLSLQDAFNKQVAAMKDYVLTSRYDSETGYSAAELAAKGTIKKRLDDLESEYSTLNGKFNDELDPTKVGSLAYQIAQNNIAIATAQGLASSAKALAERDSAYLRSLLAGWDNGGTLGDMVSEAAGLLTALKSDTAKYKFAYDTLSTYYEKWNEAVKLANEASSFIGASNKVKVLGNEVTSLQDMADAYNDAVENLQDQIDALRADVDNILATLQKEVTGITIQGTYNPIFGSFAYPIDVQSNILATYYGEVINAGELGYEFPAGDEFEDVWANGKPAILDSELEAISPKNVYTVKDGILMVEGEDNAGKLYLTVNPSNVDFEKASFTLRASDNTISKVQLSPLEASTEQLKWGYKRAASENSPNGFYVANAKIDSKDVKDVTLSFNLKSIASDVQSIMQDWSKTSAADIAKLALKVVEGMKTDVPRLGVQYQWKDATSTNPWKNYVSKYDLAAVSVKPMGFDFLNDADYSPAIVKFHNKLVAKEKAFEVELIQEIANMIKINLGLPTTGGDIVVVGDQIFLNVTVPIPSINFSTSNPAATVTITIKKGEFFPGYTGTTLNPLPAGASYIPVENTPITTNVAQITGSTTATSTGTQVNITPLYEAIAGSITKAMNGIKDNVSSTIDKYMSKIINFENKIFGKIESVAKNPNRYLQPALIGSCNQFNGFFYPSRNYLAPTQIKKGQKIMFYPTTLTGETVVPAFKKYVAISGVWKVGDIYSTDNAKDANDAVDAAGEKLNTVFDGAKFNIQNGFDIETDKLKAGYVYEFIYECLGYNGKVAGKKYYIEVYE